MVVLPGVPFYIHFGKISARYISLEKHSIVASASNALTYFIQMHEATGLEQWASLDQVIKHP